MAKVVENKDLPVEIINDITKIYGSEASNQKKRLLVLSEKFKQEFGHEPEFFIRSPGRVNLIGEHIDYHGYSVLPAAIEKDVIIAVSKADKPIVELRNINPKYEPYSFKIDVDAGYCVIDKTIHAWSNYFKCGFKGALDSMKTKTPCGMNCFFDGTVPSGAGVSSSAAMVCSSCLATFYVNGINPKKVDLTQYAIKSERYCGVESGGMDQSASIMGEMGKALLISFFPQLDVTPVQFPECDKPFVFVIANTLVVADKVVTAPVNYNLRVVEGRIVSALLSKILGLSESISLMDVQDKYVTKNKDKKNSSDTEIIKDLLEIVETKLTQKEGYTLAEAAAALGMSEQEVKNKFIQNINVRYEKLHLYRRAKHIFSEALRVYQFRDVCKKLPPYSGDLTKDLGELMNASQTSCSDLCECSCKELNELCKIAINAGAIGSRLTGAGWGGCTVSLVPEDKLEKFKETLKKEFYYQKYPEMEIKSTDSEKVKAEKIEKMNDTIFETKPSYGIAIITKEALN